MLPHLLAKSPEASPGKLFWTLILGLVAGQFIAFWMLCAQQVRKAEVRDATLRVERMAMADCLRYIPKATLSSCASRVASKGREAGPMPAGHQPSSSAAVAGATPVKLSLH